MELDTGDRPALDRGDDGTLVVDLRDRNRLFRDARIAVREVDVGPVEPVEDPAGPFRLEPVPAHVRYPARPETLDPPAQNTEPPASLLAVFEEQLKADADSEQGSSRRRPLAQSIGEAALLEPARCAARVTDACDHRERRFERLRR